MNKKDTDNYSRLLSQKGYCVINLEYTKADGPENKYFTDQLAEIYTLFDFVKNNKDILSMKVNGKPLEANVYDKEGKLINEELKISTHLHIFYKTNHFHV